METVMPKTQPKHADIKEMTFERALKELESIVTRLERGDVPVDEAIELFRRGEEVYKACVERLQGAELRIEELSPEEPRT